MKHYLALHYVSICITLLITLCVNAQSPDSLFRTKIVSSFQNIVAAPQEKVYLHTDKPYYFSGDTIWLKAYLTNAITHFQSKGSRFVYAELINRKNRMMQRIKIPMKDEMFLGSLALPPDMEEGDYYLRAYTHWMLNAGSEYFFSKNIQIYASQSSFMLTDISYEQKENKRTATITFRRPGGGVFDKHYVHYMVRTKNSENRFRQQQTNQKGEIQIDIPEKGELEQYIYVILEDKPLKYKRTFYVPEKFDYKIDFFPEGGSLIAGSMQKIAFKAQGSDGHSVPVKGFVLNNNGDTITSFQSLHDGIGNFMLNVQKGGQYKAITTAEKDGTTRIKESALPVPETGRYALSVNVRKNMAHYQLLHSPDNHQTKTFYLVGHVRGFILFVNRLEHDAGVIDLSSVPNGILSLILFDDEYIPQSERLVFVRNTNEKWHIAQDKPSYEPRSKVSLDINLTDREGNPLEGDFSLSVTDNNAVQIDSSATSILSHLLLTSDLKGYIETPGYYFKDNTLRTHACLDNLMLTHGWSRFDVKGLMEDKQIKFHHFIEAGQFISGKVMDIRNKPLANKLVHVKLNGKVCPPVSSNSDGTFIVENITFSDTARVEAFLLEKGKAFRSNIKIDRDSFPKPFNKIPYLAYGYKQKNEYIEEIQSPYIREDGILMLRLPEVVISSRSLVKDQFSSFKIDDEEMIQQQDARTALDLVKTVPGFQIIDNRPYLDPKRSMRPEMLMSKDVNNRNALRPNAKMNYGRTVRFMLDNKSIAYDVLPLIEAKDIISVHKIDPEVDAAVNFIQNMNALEDAYREALENGATMEELDELEVDQQIKKAIDGEHRTSGGCIILTSRTGKLPRPRNDSREDQAFLLGINKYRSFYVPHYDVPQTDTSLPDNRTTIHWQPKLSFNHGTAHVQFFTADRRSYYTVIIEGLTNQGVPCRYEYLLKR